MTPECARYSDCRIHGGDDTRVARGGIYSPRGVSSSSCGEDVSFPMYSPRRWSMKAMDDARWSIRGDVLVDIVLAGTMTGDERDIVRLRASSRRYTLAAVAGAARMNETRKRCVPCAFLTIS